VIETTYSLTQGEFAEAQALWCPQATKKLPGAWLMTSIYIAFGVVFGLSLSQIPVGIGIAFALWFIAFLALATWRKRLLVKFQYEQMGESARDVILRLDDVGYHDYKEGSGSCTIAWKRFTGWRESPNIFVLGLNLQFITIPKAALSEDQQSELRALLQSSIHAR